MKTFINTSSVVRKIWGTTDITLFIFAGASAEFALNKQVDWLYFTGKLPADPIGRLFSTIQYAKEIIFYEEEEALSSIDRINKIHHNVESLRGKQISNAGYQDVLYMLIRYSMAAYELLEKKLTAEEKEEIVHTFNRIGKRMHIHDLPVSYAAWRQAYLEHLHNNLENSGYTKDLFKQYRKHLGAFRYFLIVDIQRMLVSAEVNNLLGLGKPSIIRLLIPFYRLLRKLPVRNFLILSMVPRKFKAQVKNMERNAV